MKQSHKTLSIWLILLVVFVFVYRAFDTPQEHFVPGFGLGAMSGLFGGMVVLRVANRLGHGTTARLWYALLFVIEPVGAIAGACWVDDLYGLGIGAIDAAFVAWLAAVIVRNILDRRALVRFGALARAPGPLPEGALHWLARKRPVVALNGANALVGAGRAADAERVARDVATVAPSHTIFRAILLVNARIQLGDLDGARAAIALVRTATAIGLPAIHDALVRTADGEAAAVAAELAHPAPADQPPYIARMRRLAHADACAASGDRARAAQIVAELAAADPQIVAHLAGSNRPIAALAHAMAHDVPVGPFR